MLASTADMPVIEMTRIRGKAVAEIARVAEKFEGNGFWNTEDLHKTTHYKDYSEKVFSALQISPGIPLDCMAANSEMTTTLLDLGQNQLFLDGVREFARCGKLQEASVSIHSRVNDLLESGEFETCDELLSIVNPYQDSLRILLSFLMGTVNLGEQLPARQHLFAEASIRFFKEIPEEAEEILSGLDH